MTAIFILAYRIVQDESGGVITNFKIPAKTIAV